MIYSVDNIVQLRVAAVYFDLAAPSEFWNLPADQMAAICNGVGPAAWFRQIREKLTLLAGDYGVVAAIHDVQQEFGAISSKAASWCFLQNSLKVWHRRHGLKGLAIISAWVELALAAAAFAALYIFGEKYWKEAGNADT